MSERLLKLKDVIDKTTLSRSTIYLRIADRDFPAPVKLGTEARSARWVESEVDEWIQQQIDKARRT